MAPALRLDPARAVTLLPEAGGDATGQEPLAAVTARSGRDAFELVGLLAARARR